MARPKRVFTDEIVHEMEQMALNGCQNTTIAIALDIPKTTVIRRFGPLLRQKRCERKALLRENQTQLSKTNPAMAIFLGKNELGQTDKQTHIQETTAPAISDEERKAYEESNKVLKLRLANV